MTWDMSSNTKWIIWTGVRYVLKILMFPYRLFALLYRGIFGDAMPGASFFAHPPAQQSVHIEPIHNRLERLEVDVNRLSRLSEEITPREESSDAAAERIRLLEAELAETKKVSTQKLLFLTKFEQITLNSLFLCIIRVHFCCLLLARTVCWCEECVLILNGRP